MHKRNTRGVSLLEILIGTVILVMISIPIAYLLWSSKGTVKRVDQQREVLTLVDRIMTCVESKDLNELFNDFSSKAGGPKDIVASNPLGLEPSILGQMSEIGLGATLQFEFLSRSDLGIDSGNDFNSETGIFFLQAGNATLRFSGGPVSSGALDRDTIQRTVYCPLILGRPGLLLSQCPALDEDRKDELASLGVQ